MARIRTIKPDFWTSEKLASVSRDARLLFIGMWNFSDDRGVMPAKVGTLKAQVFPMDTASLQDLRGWVDELIGVRAVVSFVADVDGEEREFWWCKGFKEHQRINNPSASNLPLPPGVGDWVKPRKSQAVRDKSVTAVVQVSDQSCSSTAGKGREVNAPDGAIGGGVDVVVHTQNVDNLTTREGEVSDKSSTSHRQVTKQSVTAARQVSDFPDWFEEAWRLYPKRSGANPKPDAWRAAQARIKDGFAPEDLLRGVVRYRRWCEHTGKLGTEVVAMASTFFGPSKRFMEDYDLPAQGPLSMSAAADAAMAQLTGNTPPQAFDDEHVFDGTAERLDDPVGDDGYLLGIEE